MLLALFVDTLTAASCFAGDSYIMVRVVPRTWTNVLVQS